MPKEETQSNKREKLKLEKLVEIIDGDRGQNYPKNYEFQNKGYCLFLNAKNVTKDGFLFNETLFISEDKDKKLGKGKMQRGDCVLSTRGTVGNSAYYSNSVVYNHIRINSGMVILRAKKRLYEKYLKFYLDSPFFKNQIKNRISGSAQPQLPIKDLKTFDIIAPPLKKQRKIADILSIYDNLIENNNRRIEILEEIAQKIYKEWFVHFRFPGSDKVKMVESDTDFGKIPEGWVVTPLKDVVTTQYGYTASAQKEAIGPKYVRGTDINKTNYINWGTVPYCQISEDEKMRYMLNKGDIIIIRMADPGKVGIVEEGGEAVFASYLIRLKIKNENVTPYYLFYFLNFDKYQEYIRGAAGGTTRKSASARVIIDTNILIPSDEVLSKFENQISTLRDNLNNLLNQNQKLKQARDSLLPKLVSGKIEVK